MAFVQVGLELKVTHFVAWLKFSVIFCFFLNSVIRQMYKLVGEVVDVKFSAGSTEITLLVKVRFVISVHARYHRVRADVELASIN